MSLDNMLKRPVDEAIYRLYPAACAVDEISTTHATFHLRRPGR